MSGSKARLQPMLSVLSTPPKPGSGALIFHGARILLLLMLAGLVTALFPRVAGVDVARYERQTVATEDVIAEFAFEVRKSPAELERERIEVAARVPPTFDLNPAAPDSMLASVGRLMSEIESRAAAGDDGTQLQSLLSGIDIQLTAEQLALLLDPNLRADLRAGLVNGVEESQGDRIGVIEGWGSQYATVGRFNALVPGQPARVVDIEEVQTAGDLFEAVGRQMPLSLQTPTGQALTRLILIRTLRADFTPNLTATEIERAQARRAVSTIKANVMAGEAIVRANQQIGDVEVDRLEAYTEDRRNRGLLESEGFDLSTVLGSFLLAATLFAIYGLIVLLFRPEVYRDFRWLSLHALLIAAFFGIAMVIARQGFATQLLPVSFVALTVAVLWDGRLALALAAILAVLAGALPPFAGGHVLTTTLIAGAAAALSVRVVRRRSQFWIFVGIITAAYAVTELSLGLIQGTEGSAILLDIGWGAVSATASALAAAGFLSLFEWYTGITTDQTLLEWADPNRPLLGRLSREAPGTYAHTIGVANLSEAAAGAIGANGLLCRVGAYYHDVGKMVKPQYFIENQPSGRNPHDKLKPATSAAIVREHVTEGLRMAHEERVPQVVCDFIAEHHGTHEIGFFFQKALEEAEDPDSLDVRAFSYPGPRPRSKETAILMVADSLESATRALKDPSPERITDLVESVVDSKIDAGQFDDAPLTLREVRLIKDQLMKVLSGMYHQRIDYPSTKHLTEAPTSEVDVVSEVESESTTPQLTLSGDEPRTTESKPDSEQIPLDSAKKGSL